MYSPRFSPCFLKTSKRFLFLDKGDIFWLIVSCNTTLTVDELCAVSGGMTGSARVVRGEMALFFFWGCFDSPEEGR